MGCIVRKGFWGIVLATALAGCGGDTGSGSQVMLALPASQVVQAAPAPVATATTAATLTTTELVNDSLVLDPAVPSLDSAKYGPRTFQGIPSIARVGSRLWAAWLGDISAAKWEAPGNFLILAYSDNEGKSWSREFYLVPKNPVTDRTGDPRLWLAPDGKLWVLYFQSGGGMNVDGQLGAWVAVISNPLASMPTFEPGFRLADGEPNMPFQYQGRWYIPIDYLGGNPTRFRERFGKHIYAFDWANRQVTKVATVPQTPNADFNEMNFVERKDGSLLNQSRSFGGIVQSIAPAGTLTFPVPTLWGFYPSIPSRHVLSRSPSGRLVMIFNQTDNGAGRTDMTIALSNDDGKSWPYRAIFDARQQVSYPEVTYSPTGKIQVIYDRGRNGAKEIWLSEIDEDSVVRGRVKSALRLVNVPAK